MSTADLTFDEFKAGSVWLAGAGPGDPGLLTLLAAKAIGEADVIVYDALVNEEVLKLAKTGAVLHFAGKRGGKPSPKQRDIPLKLVEFAKQGKKVLRLKGGDPFIFGRGGEEALTLVAHGIDFRIVPGISAGIGGLAYAGIPVTHRDINHNVTFLTGHDSSGTVPDTIEWEHLAKGSQVLVMYMSMKHWPNIAAKLQQFGKSSQTPVAFVCHATTKDQQVLETTLGRSEADLATSGLNPPAIIVVGDSVKLRKGLDWQGALHGRVLEADPLAVRQDVDAG